MFHNTGTPAKRGAYEKGADETLTRVFRILDNANPLQTTLEFDIDAPVDLSPAENDIVISLLQYP